METLTTKTEIVNELEEKAMFCRSDDSADTPRPDNDDDTTDPKKDDGDNNDDDGEVIKPGSF
eukprot:CAMPEP_0170156970 /NCGR_PEP_ID=MMETSP0033_2-20121228/64617_1 /TAXON_ID=195969 /ORGANISM="Dolichomastix tenuilepis, Strain CCMP3274" /LENGTH=61 /DNA_ID=CAMNT_0010394353 /DNA_START=163 /DNA_END=348 /DNA_ORIENTATION=-